MHVLLIRHGQSANNILEAEHGSGARFNQMRSTDPPLSALGVQQANLLGKSLSAQLEGQRENVSVFCSSMTRALQTVQPLSKELRVKTVVHPDVHEAKGFYDTSGKVVTGMSRAAIASKFPEYDASLVPQAGQGSETCLAAVQRAQRMAAQLQSWAAEGGAAAERIVVIVSHCDFIGLLTRRLLFPSSTEVNAEVDDPEKLFQESYLWCNNTGISHLIVGASPPAGSYPAKAHLLYWNRTDHLPERMRSGLNCKSLSCKALATWARAGDGGTGMKPKFSEVRVIHSPLPVREGLIAAALGLALAACAGRMLRRA
mmetsp:Transcript_60555/g.112396  ORF Transcript_60555/g.112396 Transcript_60555/m.112396 type:complete len:314 (+) Transcript_60555:45-986(+)